MTDNTLVNEKTPYQGSKETFKFVAEQIKQRFGQPALDQYDPTATARTFRDWQRLGYKVKKGETALKSYTYVAVKDEAGNVIKKYRKTVNLFLYPIQVTKNE